MARSSWQCIRSRRHTRTCQRQAGPWNRLCPAAQDQRPELALRARLCPLRTTRTRHQRCKPTKACIFKHSDAHKPPIAPKHTAAAEDTRRKCRKFAWHRAGSKAAAPRIGALRRALRVVPTDGLLAVLADVAREALAHAAQAAAAAAAVGEALQRADARTVKTAHLPACGTRAQLGTRDEVELCMRPRSVDDVAGTAAWQDVPRRKRNATSTGRAGGRRTGVVVKVNELPLWTRHIVAVDDDVQLAADARHAVAVHGALVATVAQAVAAKRGRLLEAAREGAAVPAVDLVVAARDGGHGCGAAAVCVLDDARAAIERVLQ